MTWNLFIDDERMPTDVTWGSHEFYQQFPWTIARTMAQVQDLVNDWGFPAFISFDHDLGDDEPSGKDIANWLINYDMDNDRSTIPGDFAFYVHSRNPAGKANIEGLLNEYLAYR